MRRFRVEIRGEGLERVMIALNAASIPTIGPAFAGSGGDPGSWTVMREMTAVVDAPTPERAEARVKDNLPAGGEWDVLDAEPWGDAPTEGKPADRPRAHRDGTLKATRRERGRSPLANMDPASCPRSPLVNLALTDAEGMEGSASASVSALVPGWVGAKKLQISPAQPFFRLA
jgi:hypothetical protein